MPGPGLVLGTSIGPFAGRLDAPLLRGFALATKDPRADLRPGRVVPPMALVTQLWEAQQAGRAELVPLEFQRAAAGGVHGEHDLVVHRPILADEPLRTWVRGLGARAAGRNSLVTLYYTTLDSEGELVAEQWWTTVWLGVTCEESGSPAPDHTFPAAARDHPIGSWHVEIDGEMARRYATASGDWSPHHFELEAARQSGAEGVFLHGLCTMALCARGVAVLTGADPEDIERVAVRFARPALLGDQLDVHLYDAGPAGYAFEATTKRATVINHGRAELRPPVHRRPDPARRGAAPSGL